MRRLIFFFVFGFTTWASASPECIQRLREYGRRFPELQRLVERMESNWPANHKAIEYLRNRVIGLSEPEPEMAFYRLVARPNEAFELEEMDYFKFLQSVGVQSLLDEFPLGPFATPLLRAQLRAEKKSKGVILGLMPSADWQVNAVEWLRANPQLDALPRSILAEGMRPVLDSLRGYITQIHYNALGTSWGGMQLLPGGETYPIHLFGGHLDIAVVSGLDRLLIDALAAPLKQIDLILHTSFSGIIDLENPDGSGSCPIPELEEEERDLFFSRFASEVSIRMGAKSLKKKAQSQYFTLTMANGKIITIDFQP